MSILRRPGTLLAATAALALTVLDAGAGPAGAMPGPVPAATSAVVPVLAPTTGGASADDATTAGRAADLAPATDPGSPSVHITSISPRTPAPATTNRLIRFTVVVTAGLNDLADTELTLHRGNPLITRQQLTDAVTTPPATDDVDIPPVPITVPIPAGRSRTFVLTTSLDGTDPTGVQGLCLSCNPGVYPVDVSLEGIDGAAELARAHTFVPSFDATPQPVQVSWVWPLLDHPHRGASATIFTDDALATSVSAGGRLDRALRVAELVRGKVRLTLLIDPETIDALTVMSKKYEVVGTDGVVRAGTGTAAARQWLRRLAVVARSHDLVRTAYADPDVDSLARNSVGWSPVLDAQIKNSLRTTLGVDPGTSFSWPAGERLSSQGLDSVVSNGASAVLLSDQALAGGRDLGVTPDALAPLPSASGPASALVLDSALQSDVTTITTRAASAFDYADATQFLLAQLAIRAVAEPTKTHFAVLAPTRYVDADPVRTAAAMTAIATAPFGRDLSVAAALAQVQAVDHGSLVATSAAGLGGDLLGTLANTRTQLEALRECLLNQDASTLLGAYPAALSRGESSYWRTDQQAGQTFAQRLLTGIAVLSSRVRITSPNNASYTLASSDAPLFISVENTLAVDVSISLRVQPVPGEQGLTTRTVAAVMIPPGTTHQFRVGTHVERTGTFRMVLTLVSPGGKPLGTSSQIRVRSTAFGAVALWITGVAFAVLVLALVLRTIRRIRHRGARPPRATLTVPAGAAR